MLQSKINEQYAKHNFSRACQGDIFRDISISRVIDENGVVEEFVFPYIVLLSQDCDIDEFVKSHNSKESTFKNQYLPSLLFTPAFQADQARKGEHLKDIFGVTQENINTERWKQVKQNKNERYHYLPNFQGYQIPDLLIDFKAYFTISYDQLIRSYQQGNYIGTINELFRERLSQRFANYLSRIGLPSM